MKTNYNSDECNLSSLNGQTIGVVGYGIQGRAQALNLRDSGVNVLISNRDDSYRTNAIDDGFSVVNLDKIAEESDVLMLLIPDSTHMGFIQDHFLSSYKADSLLIFAHGYSLRFEQLNLPDNIDIAMIAPRYPGQQIRDYYLQGSGVPAFVDIVKDVTRTGLPKTLALCKAIGFSKGGMLSVSYKEEAEIDLFIEQFMAPLFYSAVENSIEMLTKRGYSKLVACLELYFSGELGAVRTMMAKSGMYTAFKNNASPTCQFGVASRVEDVFIPELKEIMEKTLDRITSGQFANELEREEKEGYPVVKKFFDRRKKNLITESEGELMKIIKRPL
jgi:ketol-acid reductoisomerase